MSGERRVLIVEARFYEDIADEMAKGAIQAFDQAGVGHDRLAVPGVFEIPAAVRFALRSTEIHAATTDYDGFVALGAVIRGETDHHAHLAREATRALMDIAVDRAIALGFGVLTCDTEAQARARAAVEGKNKGGEAARACLRMMELRRALRLAKR